MVKLSELQKSPEAFAGSVSVCGWVRTFREGKTMGFIELTDGSCFRPVQIVYERDGDYVEKLRSQLKQLLKNCDGIQLK